MIPNSEARALWQFVFGNAAPVFVEIGPGHGELLLQNARRRPHHNFFAIERAWPQVRQMEADIARLGLRNARVLRADAACVIASLPDACVTGYYVLFPDPWWKRRHQRRRLLTPTVAVELSRTLLPGGTIQLVTDVRDYFLLAQAHLCAVIGLEPADAPEPDTITRFARKAQARGDPLYSALYRRRTVP